MKKVKHYDIEFRPVKFGDGSIRGITPQEVYQQYLDQKKRAQRDWKRDLDFKRKRIQILELMV